MKTIKVRGLMGDKAHVHVGEIAMVRVFDGSLRDNATGEPVSRAAMFSPKGMLKIADAIYAAYAPERRRRP